MFTFAYPGLLFLLFLIPGMVFLFLVSRYVRRRRLARLGNPSTLGALMPALSRYKPAVRLVAAMAALFGIIFALARPWGGVRSSESAREGIEIVIAVDASNSMLASATADEKGPDRMRMAKLVLEKLINRLSNDRVGLIAYAGDAYTLIPVTNDYVSAKAFLNSIDPSMITHQGTNIGAAVALAENSFSERSDVGKAIILLTDAEELEDSQGAIAMVSEAAKRGIQTDVIGIGSSPVTIPDSYRGRMVDEETGEVVRTALNEDLAIELAKAGDGIYVNAANDDAIDELTRRLSTLKRAAMESSFLVSHDELYFPFVILAIVMLVVDFVITDRQNRWLSRISFFSREAPAWLLVLAASGSLALSSCRKGEASETEGPAPEELSRRDSLLTVYSLEDERDLILRGNAFHEAGGYEKADSAYSAALGVNPRSVVASLNSGVNTVRTVMALESASQQGQLPDSVMDVFFKKAVSAFENASAPHVEKGNVSSLAFYNMGNLAFTQKNYQGAIEAYKEALRLNPADDHARRNLRIAQLQKNDDNQNQQQQQQQQNPQQDNQQQQDQQQQQNQDRQQINNETSDQILKAAERKENQRRTRIQAEPTDRSGRSTKRW